MGSIRLWETVCRYPQIARMRSRYYDRIVPEYVRGLKDYCRRVPASRRRVGAPILNDVLIALLDAAAAATSSRERDARLREMRILLQAYICGTAGVLSRRLRASAATRGSRHSPGQPYQLSRSPAPPCATSSRI